MQKPKISYYPSGQIKSEEYWINGKQIDIDKFCEDYECSLPLDEEDQLILNLIYA